MANFAHSVFPAPLSPAMTIACGVARGESERANERRASHSAAYTRTVPLTDSSLTLDPTRLRRALERGAATGLFGDGVDV
eukprot:4799579-Pleurochrysis_carterae.AAC.1